MAEFATKKFSDHDENVAKNKQINNFALFSSHEMMNGRREGAHTETTTNNQMLMTIKLVSLHDMNMWKNTEE